MFGLATLRFPNVLSYKKKSKFRIRVATKNLSISQFINLATGIRNGASIHIINLYLFKIIFESSFLGYLFGI